jgi:hypothetical protein
MLFIVIQFLRREIFINVTYAPYIPVKRRQFTIFQLLYLLSYVSIIFFDLLLLLEMSFLPQPHLSTNIHVTIRLLFLMTNADRSIDLTGGDWGLRKKQKDRHRESWDLVGVTLLMRDASNPLGLQVHLFIQRRWESGVECRSSSHGSSRVGSRSRAAMVCCYLVQTVLPRSACPVFLARQPCWTLLPLGWVHSYQPRGLWHSRAYVKAYFHCLISHSYQWWQ